MAEIIAPPRERPVSGRSHAQRAAAGPVLVASDASDSSRVALEAALTLGGGHGVPIRIVAVVPQVPVMPLGYGVTVNPIDDLDARRDALLLHVKRQIVEVAGTNAEWPIEIRVGDPAIEIQSCAAQQDARLIVLGVEHRELLDRLFAREIAIHLLRSATVPILIAPRGFSSAPAHMVLATDFREGSLRAGLTALGLYPTITRVDVAHVLPREGRGSADRSDRTRPGEEALAAKFRMVEAMLLARRSRLAVTPALLHGKSPAEVVELAHATSADLLVTGSAKQDVVHRLFSASRGIIRRSPCAVLVVPTPGDTGTD